MSTAQEILNNPKKLEELAQTAFQLMDKNKDGEITKCELKAAFSELSDKEVEAILKALDTDHSGKISYDEFRKNIKTIIEELF